MKQIITTLLLGLGLGYYAAKKLTPPEIQTVEKEVVKDRIVTVIKHKKDSQGNEETTTVIEEDRKTENTVVEKKPLQPAPDWGVAVQYNSKLEYGVQVDRRILGPFSVQIGITQSGTASAGLRYEF